MDFILFTFYLMYYNIVLNHFIYFLTINVIFSIWLASKLHFAVLKIYWQDINFKALKEILLPLYNIKRILMNKPSKDIHVCDVVLVVHWCLFDYYVNAEVWSYQFEGNVYVFARCVNKWFQFNGVDTFFGSFCIQSEQEMETSVE